MKPTALRNLLLVSSTLLALPALHSATLYWDANNTGPARTDGAGAWLGADQWWTGSANTNWTDGDSAVFGYSTAGGAVTLASPTTVGSLTFNPFITTAYTLGTSGQALTLNSGINKNAGSHIVNISSPITLGGTQTWTNNSSANKLQINSFVTTTTGQALTLKGTGEFNFPTTTTGITGAGSVVVDGAYLNLISGGNQAVNNFSGGLTIQNNGEILYFSQAGGTGGLNLGSGNINLNGGILGGYFNQSFTHALGTGAGQFQITGGVSGFGVNGSNTINFSNVTEVQWGSASFNPSKFVLAGGRQGGTNNTFAEGIDLNGANRTITTGGTGTLSAVVRTTSGTAGLIKEGAGNLSLTAANTYNGATTVSGGTLTLSGNGTILNTTGITLNTGGLSLVNIAQVSRVPVVAVGVTNGGAITYTNTSGANVYTDTLGAVGLTGGLLNINLATNQASTGSQTLTLGGLTLSGTSSVAFSAAGTSPQAAGNKNMIVVTGAGTTNAGEIIGPWATTGTAIATQTDYAVYSGDFVTPAAIAASAESTWSEAHAIGSNYTLANASGSAFNGRLTATRNVNSVRNTTAVIAVTATNATDVINLAAHGFVAGDVVVFGGTTAPTGLSFAQPYYVINPTADTFQVSATSGGTATLFTADGSAVNIAGGITLSTGNNLGTYGILNTSGAPLVIGRSGTGVVTLPTTTSGNLFLTPGNASIQMDAPIADNGAGVLSLVKNGNGTLILRAANNTYTGDTIINAGTLQIGVSGSNAQLNGGAYAGNIYIGRGATLTFTGNSSNTLSGIISGDGNVNLNRGSTTLSGANTYTGKTSITLAATNALGSTISVSSFNSVVGGTASSALGAPTTVANGTIDFGGGSIQQSAQINYNGSGETSDRIVNFQFNGNGANRTIDVSGSGLLKFTSPFISNGTATNNVVLQGSSNGELVGGLPFAFANFTKSGTGTWTLGGVVGSTGVFSISAGTLVATDPRALGAAIGNLATSGPTIAGSGTLSLRNDSSVTFGVANTGYNINNSASGATLNVDRVSGTGPNTITVGNLTTTSTAASWQLNFTGANGVSLNAGALTAPLSTAATTHTINNNIATTNGASLTLASISAPSTFATPALRFNGTGTTIVTGAITQTTAALALTKNGAGTLVLNSASTYAGGTTVNAGTLSVGNKDALGTAAVSVNAGSTLNLNIGVNGLPNTVTLDPAATVSGTGTLTTASDTVAATVAPGNSAGALVFTSTALTLSGVVNMEIGGTTAGTFDTVGSNGSINLSGTVNVSLIGGFVPVAGNSWNLFAEDTTFESTAILTLPTLPLGLGWDTSTFATTGSVSVISVVPPTLGASATVSSFSETAASPASVVTVSVPVAPVSDLVVAISADATEVTVPATVTILAGNTSADFNVAAVNDNTADGNQIVAIGVTAAGYTPGSVNVNVTDVGVTDPVAAYTAAAGLTGNDALPGADPDGDGIKNSIEYALGISPTSSNGPEYRGIATTTPAGALNLAYRRPKNGGVSGVTYGVEFKTSDLNVADTGWTAGVLNTDYTQVVTPHVDGLTETVTITLTGPVTGQKYARLKVEF